ncbi:hypothetical protein LBYZC6_07080 [Lacrimispora brassicae]
MTRQRAEKADEGGGKIVADPENEYKDLCFNLGGDWINAVGGSGGRINRQMTPCNIPLLL